MKKLLLSLIAMSIIPTIGYADTMAFQADGATDTSSATTICTISGTDITNTTFTQEGICSFSLKKVNNSTANVNSGWVRWYKSDIITLTPASDITVNKITIHCGDGKFGKITIGNVSKTTSTTTTDAAFENLNTTSAISISNNAQIRFSYIEIDYTKSGAADPDVPANLTVKYGDVTVAEDNDVVVEEGTKFAISADNATNITITNIIDDVLLDTKDNPCEWTPQIMAEDLITITAKNGEKFISTSFTLTVYAKDTRADANLSFAEATVNHDINDEFAKQTLANPDNLTVTWSSSDIKVATIDATTGDITIVATGTTTIRATFDGNDKTKPGFAEYTLIVADRRISVVTFDFVHNDYGMVRYSGTANDYNPDPFIFSNGWIGVKATGRNRLWSTKGLRVYKDANITLYAPENCTLTSVRVLNEDGSLNNARTEDFIVNATNSTFTCTVKNNDLAQIEITYTGATDEELAAAFQSGTSLSMTVNGNEYAEESFTKTDEADAVVSLSNIYPHAKIYYQWTANPSEIATYAEEGYTEFTAPLSLDRAGQLNYYAELNGQTTAVKTLTIQGPTTTSISEVKAANAGAAEWFDLQGRRVATPSKGNIYILKQGSRTTKLTL